METEQWVNDVQGQQQIGAVSNLYHTDGICGRDSEGDLGQQLLDVLEEKGKAGFLRELKRCIRLRTFAQNRILYRARMDLIADIINGRANELFRTMRLRVSLIRKMPNNNNTPRGDQARRFVVELEDGHQMELGFNTPRARELFDEFFGNTADWLFTSAPDTEGEVNMKIDLRVADVGGALQPNPAIRGDLSHFRILHQFKRLYMLVKFLDIDVQRTTIDFVNLEQNIPDLLYIGATIERNLVLNLRNVLVARGGAGNNHVAISNLWIIHRQMQQFMNQVGFRVTLAGRMPPQEYTTFAFPYLPAPPGAPLWFNRDDVNRSIYEYLVANREFTPGPGVVVDREIRRHACRLMSRDYLVQQAINSEFTGNLDVPDTQFMNSIDQNFRVLPYAARSMNLWLGLFDQATWTGMLARLEYLNVPFRSFDTAGTQYTCSEMEADNDDVPRRIENAWVNGPDAANLCRGPINIMSLMNEKLKNVRDFMYLLARYSGNFTFCEDGDPVVNDPNTANVGILRNVVAREPIDIPIGPAHLTYEQINAFFNKLAVIDNGRFKWRIPRECFLGYINAPIQHFGMVPGRGRGAGLANPQQPPGGRHGQPPGGRHGQPPGGRHGQPAGRGHPPPPPPPPPPPLALAPYNAPEDVFDSIYLVTRLVEYIEWIPNPQAEGGPLSTMGYLNRQDLACRPRTLGHINTVIRSIKKLRKAPNDVMAIVGQNNQAPADQPGEVNKQNSSLKHFMRAHAGYELGQGLLQIPPDRPVGGYLHMVENGFASLRNLTVLVACMNRAQIRELKEKIQNITP